MLLLVLGYTGYKCKSIYDEYSRKDVTSDFRIVEKNEIKLPSVTFCDKRKYWCGILEYKNQSHNQSYCDPAKLGAMKYKCRVNGNWSTNCPNIQRTKAFSGCITFNPNQTMVQTVNGKSLDSSLQISIKDTQMTVFLHRKDDNPTSYFDMILLDDKGYYDLSIDQTDITRLQYPYVSNCTDTNTISSFNYTVDECKTFCFLKEVHNECGGVPDQSMEYLSHELMLNSTDTSKTEAQIRECIYQKFKQRTIAKCTCQLPCRESIFEANLERKIEEKPRKSWMFTIYFKRKQIKNITERPLYEGKYLLADLGGLVGLLVGMSALSLVELVVYFVLWIKHILCGSK